MGDWPLPALALAVVLGLTTLLWLVSLALRDASVIDAFWGTGFVVLAWLYHLASAGTGPRRALVVGLVTLWGLRLTLHILDRNRGRGEDYRYRAMRERRPATFPLWSLVFVYWLQGLLLWLIAMPLYQAQHAAEPLALTPLDWLATVLFAVGFGFEAVGDLQLRRFRRDPGNAGRVMDQGLWRYTRHPNYFGDAIVWWSFFCFAAATPGGGFSVVSPLLMTALLLRVSGVTLLEKRLAQTKPGYRDYAARTSAFFPWFPADDR